VSPSQLLHSSPEELLVPSPSISKKKKEKKRERERNNAEGGSPLANQSKSSGPNLKFTHTQTP